MAKNNMPASAAEEIRQLKQRVKDLEAASQTRAPLDTVTGGTFQVLDAAGNALIKIGRLSPNLTDGSPQYGVEMYRQTGDEQVGGIAFALVNFFGNIPAQGQGISMYDSGGRQIFGDDVASEFGLALPYMPMPLTPANSALWPSTTSAAMVDMWMGFPTVQNPRITVWGYVNAPVGTNASVQLVTGSTVVAGPVAVSGSGGNNVFELGPASFASVTGASFAQIEDVRIQACRTAGTGTVSVGLLACFGIQS